VRFTTYVDALTWLESHVDYELVAPNRREVPTLQPLVDTLAMLADPQRDYPRFTSRAQRKRHDDDPHHALLSATGLRVGAFTIRTCTP